MKLFCLFSLALLSFLHVVADGAILRYLSSQEYEAPINFPVEARICFKTKKNIDESIIKQTLEAIQSTKVPKFFGDKTLVEGFQYEVKYVFVANCDPTSNIIIELKREPSRKNEEKSSIMDETANIVFHYASSLNTNEISGRVAGMISSAVELAVAPDLTRQLFFSLIEDDGVEVSIVGFQRANQEAFDPLRFLDLKLLISQICLWLELEERKVIVKSTTRDISDHPAIFAALLNAQEYHSEESYDPSTGRFKATSNKKDKIDGEEFVRGISETSDALFRTGSAARLVRLRRREVQVSVLIGKTGDETFRDNSRLYVSDLNIAIIIPPSSIETFNLTNYLLYGLADCLAGVMTRPKDDRWISSSLTHMQRFPTWIPQRAMINTLIHEIYRYLKITKESLSEFPMQQTLPIQVDALVASFEEVRSLLKVRNCTTARQIIRGPIRQQVKLLNKASRIESKKCCEVRYFSIESDIIAKKKHVFVLLYVVVALFSFMAVSGVIWLSNKSTLKSARFIFERQHLD